MIKSAPRSLVLAGLLSDVFEPLSQDIVCLTQHLIDVARAEFIVAMLGQFILTLALEDVELRRLVLNGCLS